MISIHATGIDAPVAVRKVGRTTVAPHANWMGDYEIGTTANGTPTSQCAGATDCPVLLWPGGQETADGFLTEHSVINTWWGSLITEKTDASGYRYMRNRYYNPQTGQFTQIDPIGLAGGVNLYGFADGDPVNFTDPFGLCPPRDNNTADCTVILNGAQLSNPVLREQLTEFARYVGRDIHLNGARSGDRSAADNGAVKGAQKSPHLSNEGADIHVRGIGNLDLARQADQSGLFTGLGYYEGSTKTKHGPHVHVDVKNRKATWWEDKTGQTRPHLPPEETR